MTKFICILAFVACANAGVVKRAFIDDWVGVISDFGSSVLPEEAMRAGCDSVGLYNREKNGGKPIRDASFGRSGVAGAKLARIGDTVFSRSGMEQGCINAGFYDPNLDFHGRPKTRDQLGGQGGFGSEGQTTVYNQHPHQHQPQTGTSSVTYTCTINGAQVPCDPQLLAQAGK